MTVDSHPAAADRAFPAREALPWLFALGAYVFLLAMGPKLLNDPDSYWHLALAHWIIEHRTFPTADPFSHTATGAPWIAFEWLSEMAFAGAYWLAKWAGVAALSAACIALSFALVGRFLVRTLDTVPTLILLLAAFLLVAPHMLARPHAIVMPVMVAWVCSLVRTMDEHGRPPFAALPLLVLWANLHGSVSFGIALIGPAALEALWGKPPRDWLPTAGPWVLFGVLALVAASITPYGPGVLLVPLHTFGLAEALSIITEWRPQDFSHLGAFEVLLLAAIGFALLKGITLPPVRILVLLGLTHFALSQSRQADLLALLVPLYLARPLGAQLKQTPQEPVGLASPPLVFVATALTVVLATVVALTRNIVPDPRQTPQAAIAATDLAHAGPVLNAYDFGGYLIYAGIAPFIDGRGELYGRALMMRHARAMQLQDLPDFLRLLDDYRINATLLTPKTPAVALLDRLPEWRRVYADDIAVVHKRRAPAP